MDEQTSPSTPKVWSGKNTILTILGIVVIIAVMWYIQPLQTPQDEVSSEGNSATSTATSTVTNEENSAADLETELQGIDTSDLEKEFESIDTDLNSL